MVKENYNEVMASRIFDFFDKEKKGILNPSQVQALFEETFRGYRVTEKDINKTIDYALGEDGNGTMTKRQYTNFIKKIMEKAVWAD